MKKIIIMMIAAVCGGLLSSCSDSMESSYYAEAKDLNEKLEAQGVELYDPQWNYLKSMKEVLCYDIVREMSPLVGMAVPSIVNNRYAKWNGYAEYELEEILADEKLCKKEDAQNMKAYMEMYAKLGMSTFLKSYRLEKDEDLGWEHKQMCDSIIQVVLDKYPLPEL